MTDHRINGPLSSAAGTLAVLLWGLGVWGAQFTSTYIGHTLLCRIDAPTWVAGTMILVLAFLAVTALAPAILQPRRLADLLGFKGLPEDRRVILTISRCIAVLSLIASIWTVTGAFLVDACILGR